MFQADYNDGLYGVGRYYLSYATVEVFQDVITAGVATFLIIAVLGIPFTFGRMLMLWLILFQCIVYGTTPLLFVPLPTSDRLCLCR